MTRNLIISKVALCTASLCLIMSAWAQSTVTGAANRSADDYKNCMIAPGVVYAQRAGTPENLAKQIARLCADEAVALSAAYVDEFFSDRSIGEAKGLAKLYVDQITAANLEIVRLDITRLRIESGNAQ